MTPMVFLLLGEGDHLDDFGQLASFLPVFPTEILGELEEGCLCLGTDETELFCLRVDDVFECSGIDRDRLIEEALELRG